MNNNIFDYIKSNLNTLAEESKGIPAEFIMQNKAQAGEYISTSVIQVLEQSEKADA